MLEPDVRAVLVDQLRPPAGHTLDAAVATTFTLSLTAALVPPISFAAFDIRDTADPIAVLESVRSCADRVDVFCQAGQIAVPSQASDLMAFLEPMVHPVMPPRPGFLFHPKVWFLRYAPTDPDDDPRYRVVCSSRNLVESNAWDAAVILDGTLGNADLPANEPLSRLIRRLPGLTIAGLDPTRRARVEGLADDAHRVVWECPDDVHSVAFHTWGLGDVHLDVTGTRHLVISPFVDAAGLAHLMPGRGKQRVVSRQEALDLLPDAPNATTWVLDPLASWVGAQDAEPTSHGPDADAHPEPGRSERAGLHAKITVVEADHRARVVIGSPNATWAAYHGNVEAAVELVGSSSRIGARTLVGDGTPLREYLQPYSRQEDIRPTADEEALEALKKVLRNTAALPWRVAVEQTTTGCRATVTSDKPLPLPEGTTAQVSLLTLRGRASVVTGTAHAVVEPVAVPDVTPFLTLEVRDATGLRVSTVVHAVLTGDPAGRLDEVLARQVDTPEKFLRFLALLLGHGDAIGGWAAATGDGGGAFGAVGAASAGILEDLVVALATRPADLDALDGLLDRLSATENGRAVIPDGFAELWESVAAARAVLEEDR